MREVAILVKKRVLAVYVILIFSAMMLSNCTRPPSESVAGIGIGSRAPNFKLFDLSGKEVSLNQYKGKVVLLDFWATWCGPCRMTMPLLERLQKEYSDVMVQMAINLQEPKDVVRDYVQAQGIHALVLLDESGSVGEAYGAEAIPRQVVIDKEGVVRYIQTGFSPRMSSQLRAEIQKLR
jgi:cytochrome c biogenesis protein CcmG/thiol:disulfide interchange protein DsbE